MTSLSLSFEISARVRFPVAPVALVVLLPLPANEEKETRGLPAKIASGSPENLGASVNALLLPNPPKEGDEEEDENPNALLDTAPNDPVIVFEDVVVVQAEGRNDNDDDDYDDEGVVVVVVVVVVDDDENDELVPVESCLALSSRFSSGRLFILIAYNKFIFNKNAKSFKTC